MPTVYLETTIPSYLAAHLSRDLIIAAHQQITQEWWKTAKDRLKTPRSKLRGISKVGHLVNDEEYLKARALTRAASCWECALLFFSISTFLKPS